MTPDITKEDFEIVRKVLGSRLKGLEVDVYVFGSRAARKARKYSDLDLALESEKIISDDIIAQLKFDFENSLLPYKVDIIDLRNISGVFKARIKNNLVKIAF